MLGLDLAVTETLTRVRAADVDEHGDPVGEPDEAPVPGCVVWPGDGNGPSGNEQTFGQMTVITGWSALLPVGTDAKATDQWRRAGSDELLEQVGEPAVFVSPFTGDSPGVLIQLRRVTG